METILGILNRLRILVIQITRENMFISARNDKKSAFTLLEVLTVVIIIGILAGLAYSSLIEIVFANRAKETAHIMRTFAERAITEAKRQEDTVEIKLDLLEGKIKAKFNGNPEEIFEPLSSGFNSNGPVPNCSGFTAGNSFNGGVLSVPEIGMSSIGEENEGYFVACGAKGYCAAAVKANNKNFFIACIKKGNDADWEEL